MNGTPFNFNQYIDPFAETFFGDQFGEDSFEDAHAQPFCADSPFQESEYGQLLGEHEFDEIMQAGFVRAHPGISPLKELEMDYRHLFNKNEFKEIVHIDLGNNYDVEMDEFLVIKIIAGQDGKIGTTGVSSCIVVCARGSDQNGNIYLALTHMCIKDSKDTFDDMFEKMISMGCAIHTIETFAIGGIESFSDEDAPIKGTYKKEKELLDVGKDYNLKAVHLHVNEKEDDGVDVLITTQSIFYARST